MLGKIYPVLPKCLAIHPFNMDEAPKVNFQLVLRGQVKVRRLFSRGLGLRNQNGLDLTAHENLPLPGADKNRNWEEFEGAKVEKPFHGEALKPRDALERPAMPHQPADCPYRPSGPQTKM